MFSGTFFCVTTEGALTAVERPPSSLYAEPVLRIILPSNVSCLSLLLCPCGNIWVLVFCLTETNPAKIQQIST